MQYKTELHCHTAEVSNCASASSMEIAEAYIAAGYTSLTVTNHLSHYTYEDGSKQKYHGSSRWEDKIAFFMQGIDLMKSAAGDRLNVLWGVELRSNTDGNDYLIHGVTADFLLSFPEIMDAPLKDVVKRVHDVGGIFCQAHPFRNSMKVTKPSLLDGIEVYNGHPNHDSRNDIALLWAEKFGFRYRLSGTDYHHANHIPTGGILTDEPIVSNEQLLTVLKNGNFTPLFAGEKPFNSTK